MWVLKNKSLTSLDFFKGMRLARIAKAAYEFYYGEEFVLEKVKTTGKLDQKALAAYTATRLERLSHDPKVCRQCGVTKSGSQYHLVNGYLRPICRLCVSENGKKKRLV